MTKNDWVIDTIKRKANHKCGLVLEMRNGEVVNIVSMPISVMTRDLPVLLKDATRTYRTTTQKSIKARRDRSIINLKKTKK